MQKDYRIATATLKKGKQTHFAATAYSDMCYAEYGLRFCTQDWTPVYAGVTSAGRVSHPTTLTAEIVVIL